MTLAVAFRSAARSEFDEAAKARIESCGAGRRLRLTAYMPRALAMSPRMAANNAGSFASGMSQTRGDCRIAVESRRRVELKAGI